MNKTKIEFWRIGAQEGTSGEPAMQAHQARAEALHGMADALGIEVLDWGATDAEYSSEIVEVVVELLPVVVPALATLIKLWLDSRRLEKVTIVQPDGTRIEVGSGTAGQIADVIRSATGLSES